MRIPDIIRRGKQAAIFLEDPVFKAAIEAARDKFLGDWRAATTLDEREVAHARMIGLDQIIIELGGFKGNADLEEHKLRTTGGLVEPV